MASTERFQRYQPIFIERAAQAAHEANRILCQALGDNSQVPWSEAPQWQKDSAIQGAMAVWDNPEITPDQQHQSWMNTKLADGWKYGPVKDAEAKTHPCMVPYSELPKDQRLKDHLFGIVVRSVLGMPLPEFLVETPKPSDAEVYEAVAEQLDDMDGTPAGADILLATPEGTTDEQFNRVMEQIQKDANEFDNDGVKEALGDKTPVEIIREMTGQSAEQLPSGAELAERLKRLKDS